MYRVGRALDLPRPDLTKVPWGVSVGELRYYYSRDLPEKVFLTLGLRIRGACPIL